MLERNELISLRWSTYKFSTQIKEWLIKAGNPQFEWNQNDICLLYVIYFSLLSWGERRWLCSECLFSVWEKKKNSLLPFGDLSFMLTGWLDDWSDCKGEAGGWGGGRSGWQNVFIPPSLPLPSTQRIAGELSQTYGPMSVPGRVQKGLELTGWSVSVSAAAPRCTSKPPQRQAVLRHPRVSSHSGVAMFAVVTLKPACLALGDLSLFFPLPGCAAYN